VATGNDELKIIGTNIPDVKLIEPQVWRDNRGFFLESWNRRAFAEAGISADFVQDNHSHSVSGTLRGLHYQIIRPQGKLVRVTNGEIFDVAVDLRRSSPTFARWTGHHISAKNHHMMWIPTGFAERFCRLFIQVLRILCAGIGTGSGMGRS
jgi:dTDP-4-dehydrorhamnose 3,5-epimerase